MTSPVSADSPVLPPTTAPNSTVTSPGQLNQGAFNAAAETFNSMQDLQKKNPQLYNFMLTSLEQNIITQMGQDSSNEQAAWQQMSEG